MSGTIISQLLEIVASFAKDELLKAATAKAEVEKLEAKLTAIQPIARDAHNKQFFSKEVKDWVWRLNEIAYDAVDAIELYRIKSSSVADPTDSLQSMVFRTFPKLPQEIIWSHNIGTKIKEINERLNMIYGEKNKYELQTRLKEASHLGENLTVLVQDRLTTSVIKEKNIIGREEDEEVVIKWLSEESNPDDQVSASIIAIVGMGGVGKTALAQNIYHKCSEQGCFHKCIWVCVAKMPQVLDLLKKILEEIEGGGSSSNQLSSANTINMKIRKRLKNKRFLLVLDDVWDYGWWDELRSIWQDCGSGSKVLKTTRQVQLAQGMGLTHSHGLKCLNEEQSWHLLLNKALRRGESEKHLSAVKDVGKDIAKKCGGLPLALSSVGSLLKQKKRRKPDWQNVLHSHLCNWLDLPEKNSRVFAAVALSYMSIPYQLQQCLTYCCIYPKNFKMKKADLVRLWVAEGFIFKEQGVEIEVTAERCLDTLVGYSLIQDVGDEQYKLHDIVHDFALHLRGKEYVSMGQLKNELVSHHARYLSSFGGDCSYEALSRQDKLRGLMCHEVGCLSPYNFHAFKWLRVLDLSMGKFDVLPESIGGLILLKYLNLSQTQIFELPESITKLSKLQTLDLSSSVIKRLPDKISALAALRHLDISETSMLECLPHEIGKLTGLQTLPKFMVTKNNISGRMECSLLELHELNNLQGSLIIEHLEKVDSLKDVDHAQLKRKSGLRSLGLCCGSTDFDKRARKHIEQVYERMQPPTGIEKISIHNYPGMKCPTWMSSSTYSCLQKISIWYCTSLESLPNLGHLCNLEELEICYVKMVKVLDFTLDHVGQKITFPKLEALTLDHMESLEEWQFDADIENMPCLKKMKVSNCRQLAKLPLLPPVLISATIKFCPLVSCIQNINGAKELKHLEIVNCSKLQSLLPGLQCDNLKTLVIKDCSNLTSIPTAQGLEELELVGTLGSELIACLKLTRLRRLKLSKLLELGVEWFISKIGDMVQLEQLVVADCPKFQFLGLTSRFSLSWRLANVLSKRLAYDLVIDSVEMSDKLTGLMLHLRSKVRSLDVTVKPGVNSLPEWIQQLHQLKTLKVLASPQLTHLPLWLNKLTKLSRLILEDLPQLVELPAAIEDLHQLDRLVILKCPKLRSVPHGLSRLPRLQLLEIVGCPLLAERCRKEDPNIISNIRDVIIED